MKFDIVTIFPDLFESFKNEALVSRAQVKKIVELNVHNLRDWTTDNHKTVDDRPYGGGAGMVMMVEPIQKAVETIRWASLTTSKKMPISKKSRVIVFSAKGKKFDQAMARKYSKLDQLIMICGRYEGIDERVAKYIADDEISIGDYVLFGGEVPAMAVTEAVTRLLPGSLGKPESLKEESFSKNSKLKIKNFESWKEYPHYTRPETIEIKGKKRAAPKVLLSGNHAKIEEWRKKNSKNK